MRMDKLTIKAQEAVQQAQTLAERNQNAQIDVEHLLAALLAQSGRRDRAASAETGRQCRACWRSRSRPKSPNSQSERARRKSAPL